MARHVRLNELLVGVAGLALLRCLYDGSDETAEARLAEVREILADQDMRAGEPTHEVDAQAGYSLWAESYDEPGNPIVELEQSAVWSVLDTLGAGRALDAACGTGRHARHLVDLGHEAVGIDLTAEMLARAAVNVPEGTFLEADLRDIPFGDEEFDLVVCGLALSHLAALETGAAELARVLKPQGRLVVSVLHPFQAHLGWHAPFVDATGQRGFIREHAHTHADYLTAFRSARLQVNGCAEPTLRAVDAPAKRRAFRHIPDAAVQAYAGLPAVLVWDVEKR